MTASRSNRAVDLALGEVAPAAMHGELAADPLLAVEVAELRQMFASFETICCEPTPRFRRMMAGIQARSAVRPTRIPSSVRSWPWLAAAALITLVALRTWHPLGTAAGGEAKLALRASAVVTQGLPRPHGTQQLPSPALRHEPLPAQDLFLAVEARLANEGAERLLENLAASAALPVPRPLHAWVAPRNLMALQRLDRELLATSELRRLALARVGANPDMDARVQQLAADVAVALDRELSTPAASVAAVAASIRGLVHSGGTGRGAAHGAVLARASEWMLAHAESGACGLEMPLALEALLDHSAVTGADMARVRVAVDRFVSDQLGGGRGRPLLADWKTAPAALAAAGRMLLAAPAFGADPMACHALRRLGWSHLRERETVLGAQPLLLAAMAYGYADFAEDGDGRLQGYRLASFLPDLAAVQHVAWGVSDGARGSTRVRMELRRMAALPTPERLLDRAHLLVALAAEYVHAGPSLRLLASG